MDAIVLASSSPRRRELLTQAGIPFIVAPGDVDEEKADISGTPGRKAEQLAYMKALDVARSKSGIILGADTIVVCDDEIFGKPADAESARRMLRALSGREHLVITGIALIDTSTGRASTGYETTKVRFSVMSDKEIEAYIVSGEPFGKAGAYAIQGRAALFVESLDGCYFNVVGLPLRRLYCLLQDFGVEVNY
ncbi:MAG: septum formation inhibitor Maf [Clostridiaceae bacterium]|nr:septum formation inhibitor Maf [Clostridiaceae bacterium]